MKLVLLAKGKGVAKVDDEDYPKISKHKWCLTPHGYAQANVKIEGKWTRIQMHRFLMGRNGDLVIDHIDFDRLNNTRENLRWVTKHQNQWNRRSNSTRCGSPVTSLYKGVSWKARYEKWVAQAAIGGTNMLLGYYTTEELAARAVDQACLETRGPEWVMNFPKERVVILPPNWVWKAFTVTGEYKGVRKRAKRWVSEGANGYKSFDTQAEAYLFYDVATMERKGNKAKVNCSANYYAYLSLLKTMGSVAAWDNLPKAGRRTKEDCMRRIVKELGV